MKKLTLIFTLVFTGISSIQAQNEPKTLMNHVKSWGVVASPQLQYANFFGGQTLFASAKAGFILNNRWILGVHGGSSLIDVPSPNALVGPNAQLDFKQGGIYLEYRLAPSKLVHLTFPINFGVLHTEKDNDGYGPWGPYDNDIDYTNVYFEPGVNAEINVSRFIALHVGASYRWNDAMITPTYSDLKIPHHLLINAGLTIGINDVPKTYRNIKAALKK